MHRYVQVIQQCHSASIIVAEISMVTLVVILGVMVPSIPQHGEKVRQRVDVEATRPVFHVPLLPFDPPCVFESEYVMAEAEWLQILSALDPQS